MSDNPRPLTILFADIGSSAALYGRVGDAEAYRLIADSLLRMRAAVEENDGKVLRTVGDSVLATFDRSDQAFRGALAIQRAHLGEQLSVRIGFHRGIVIPDGGDVYGHAVNIAARVAAFARVDEIVATAAVVEQLPDWCKHYISRPDRIDVRGVTESIQVYRLHWQEESSSVTRLADRQDYETARYSAQQLRISHGHNVLLMGGTRRVVQLGRSPDSDISVTNDEASRHHAKVQLQRGQFLLQDESTNGTYVKKAYMVPFLVRRDSIVLDGAGIICLGASPEHHGADLIKFELLQE